MNYAKVNLACGRNPENKLPQPWLNVDLDGPAADYLCDISDLPDEWTGVFDTVRASHVLEHFFMEEMDSVIQEWMRVLKPGGELMIIVPDLNIVIQDLVMGKDSKGRPSVSMNQTTAIMTQIFGAGYASRSTAAPWAHHFLFNEDLLRELLERNGLVNFSVYDQKEDPAAKNGIKDDSQNPFSICVHAFKKLEA